MSADISTSYMGLALKNPLIAGSSGMTDSPDKVKRLEDAGAAAVVLKSLFEEEIVAEMARTRVQIERPGPVFPEMADMDDLIDDERGMTRYLDLVARAREALEIPVIASVNCTSAQKWTYFARMVEEAGAQGLELNIFLMPSSFETTDHAAFEQIYFDVVREVLAQVSIPVSIKVSYHFTLLAHTLHELSKTGIKGLVLFNRFFNPDFDLKDLTITATNVLSTPELLPLSLRWIAIMHGRVECSLGASTGVHSGDAVIKQLLAGADAVQLASVLYREGPEVVSPMLSRLGEWMEEHGFASLAEFRGRLSGKGIKDPAAYDRVQFVRNYRSFEQ